MKYYSHIFAILLLILNALNQSVSQDNDACPGQNECFLFGQGNAAVTTDIISKIQESVTNFVKHIIQGLQINADYDAVHVNVDSVDLVMPCYDNTTIMRQYLINQIITFDQVGQFLENLITSPNDQKNASLQYARPFASCPINKLVNSQNQCNFKDQAIGNFGGGSGLGMQFYLYDPLQQDDSKRFTMFANVGGGGGGGATSYSSGVYNTWGSGGGGGLEIIDISQENNTQQIHIGGGLGYGYDSPQCPQSSMDQNNDPEQFQQALANNSAYINDQLRKGQHLFIQGGGGGGAGIATFMDQQEQKISFGFGLFLGAEVLQYFNKIYNSTNSPQPQYEQKISDTFASCSKVQTASLSLPYKINLEEDNSAWTFIQSCICSKLSPTEMETYMPYINCTSS